MNRICYNMSKHKISLYDKLNHVIYVYTRKNQWELHIEELYFTLMENIQLEVND